MHHTSVRPKQGAGQGDTFSCAQTLPSPNNRAIHSTAQIVKHIMTLAVEATMGMLFINSKLATQLQHTLAKMDHPHQTNADPDRQLNCLWHGHQQNYSVCNKSNGYAIPLSP